MECKRCGSKELVLLTKKKGVHKSLYCSECLSFHSFLSEKEAKTFIQLGGRYA